MRNGQRLRGAVLTYLDAGELLAMLPGTGHAALYRRAPVHEASSASDAATNAWSLAPSTVEESAQALALPAADGFSLRWESTSVLRGWQASFVGSQSLMLLKPASGSYRMLNCSALYTASPALPQAAAAAALANGVPCTLALEGTLPSRDYCAHSKDDCLLAPQCGWCNSLGKCVPSNEDGVCFGTCPDGQLLYSAGNAPGGASSTLTAKPAAALEAATPDGASSPAGPAAASREQCVAQLSCGRCAEVSECAWCASAHSPYGGSCLMATDALAGECASGSLVQYDPSKCSVSGAGRAAELVEEGGAPTVFVGLVSQAK